MNRHRLLTGTVIAALLLATTGLTHAQGPGLEPDMEPQAALGTGFTYQGRLSDATGPVDDTCDLIFRLYDAPGSGTPPSGGTLLGTVNRNNQTITDGYFTVILDFGGPVFAGDARWLQTTVDCGGGPVTLAPRQELTAAPYALYADSASSAPWSGLSGIPSDLADGDDDTTYTAGTGLSLTGSTFSVDFAGSGSANTAARSDHDHWGQTWEGETDFLVVRNTATGNEAYLPGPLSGIYGHSDTWGGVHGQSTSNIGVYGQSVDASGVQGDSIDGHGVTAESDNTHSLYVPSAGGSGVYVESAASHGVDVAAANGNGAQVYSAGLSGVRVVSAGESGVLVDSAGWDGVRVASANWSGVYVASSGGDAIRVQTAGNDGLRLFEGMGRDYIRAGSDADLDFRVTNDGTAYADGGWQGAADFAELMTTEGSPEVYEPGDVLVISVEGDRSAALSSKPYSTLVLGIYSTDPGFVGSLNPMEEDRGDEIPVAIVGIVPCKVSAENGSVHRGDLLVTSSTPGHAMRAEDAPAGTILGKALEPLEEGTGLIQVLVTLQ